MLSDNCGKSKEKGLLRLVAGGLAWAGGATVKETAKVAGKTAKVAVNATHRNDNLCMAPQKRRIIED